MIFTNLFATKRKRSPLLFGVPIALALSVLFAPAASAASFVGQMNQLKQNTTQATQRKQQLGHEAATLAETIAAQQTEITALSDQIQKSQAKIAALQADIAKAEADLNHQRELLASNVREMYTEQDLSTIEMLASSQNFSHFFDQAQYRESLQQKIDAATKRIEQLMAQLTEQKKSVENLLADQQAMQANLDAKRAENQRLLSLNQEQQQAVQTTIDGNNAQIAKLRQQQAVLNARGFVSQPRAQRVAVASGLAPRNTASHGNSYPWANVPFPNSLSDPWGMYKRQCVSYTAWKVASSGRHMPYWAGRGNAKLWDDNAQGAGIPVDSHPRPGDVAISNAGAYGHAMYVEAVNGDGTISISQYNADWHGNYSEGRRSAAGLSFIHF